MYVHVTADGAFYYGQPPETATDGLQSWDLSDRDPARMAAAGWYAVDVSPRPADTDEITHDGEVVVSDGIPTHAWVARPWTESEIAARIHAAERDARQAADRAILDATAALMADAHADGQPWVQPTGAHDAVPFGITVTDGGKTWRSKHHANVWPPSPSSRWWEEVTDNPEPQPWALDTYYAVDTRVTFGGQTWRCTHEHLAQVGWEPGAPGMHDVWSVD